MMKLTELENMGHNQDLQLVADDLQSLENHSIFHFPCQVPTSIICFRVMVISPPNELISLACHLLLAKKPPFLDWIATIENTVDNGPLQHKKYDLSF